MMIGLLLALAIPAVASEPPFFNREVKDLRDVGALNENSRSLADGIRKSDLTNGGTVNGSLCFADGTCQTTAPVAAAAVQFSSFSFTTISRTNTSAWDCLAGSTLTWTSAGGIARIAFSGASYHSAANQNLFFRVYLDGSPAGGGAALSAIKEVDTAAATYASDVELNFTYRPTSGVHTVCLATWASAGTHSFCGNSGSCEFSVTE